MKIQIVTPEKHVVSDEADEVYVVGPKGEYGVLPGHAHYVTPLGIGRLYYRKGGERHAFVAVGGFMEVFEETVYIMADEIEKAEGIDRQASRTQLAELEKKLAHEELDEQAYAQTLAERDKAQARLDTVA